MMEVCKMVNAFHLSKDEIADETIMKLSDAINGLCSIVEAFQNYEAKHKNDVTIYELSELIARLHLSYMLLSILTDRLQAAFNQSSEYYNTLLAVLGNKDIED